MNATQQFTNESLNCSLRITDHEGQPWFVAKDVCDALEITNNRDAIASLDDDEKITVANPNGNPRAGIPHQITIISEPGLYSLILRSRKPEAKTFKRWVTHEVLPAIRKNGMCSAAQSELTSEIPYSEELPLEKMVRDMELLLPMAVACGYSAETASEQVCFLIQCKYGTNPRDIFSCSVRPTTFSDLKKLLKAERPISNKELILKLLRKHHAEYGPDRPAMHAVIRRETGLRPRKFMIPIQEFRSIMADLINSGQVTMSFSDNHAMLYRLNENAAKQDTVVRGQD